MVVLGKGTREAGGAEECVMGKQIKAIYHICANVQRHSPNGTSRRSSRHSGRKLGKDGDGEGLARVEDE